MRERWANEGFLYRIELYHRKSSSIESGGLQTPFSGVRIELQLIPKIGIRPKLDAHASERPRLTAQ